MKRRKERKKETSSNKALNSETISRFFTKVSVPPERCPLSKNDDVISKHDYKILRVYPDGRCLFSCIAASASISLRNAERSPTGIPHDQTLQLQQQSFADDIREEVVRFLQLKSNELSSKCESLPMLLDKNIGASYASLKDRLVQMAKKDEYAAYLEILAVCYLMRRQIYIYEEEPDNFKLRAKLPNADAYSISGAPILIVHSYDTKSKPGHYILLLAVESISHQPTDLTPVDFHQIVVSYQQDRDDDDFIRLLDFQESQNDSAVTYGSESLVCISNAADQEHSGNSSEHLPTLDVDYTHSRYNPTINQINTGPTYINLEEKTSTRPTENSVSNKCSGNWKVKYMFMCDENDKPLCLVCGATIAVFKKYYLKRHYLTNHSDFDRQYPIDSNLRSQYITKKENQLCRQQALFQKNAEEARKRVRASFEVALLLAKKNKPFTDSEEIVKPVLGIVARMLGIGEKQQKMLDEIPLSNCTMTRRVNDLADDVQKQIMNHALKSDFFSLALDESTDVQDVAQVTIFIRAVNDKFEVLEELLGLESLHGTTKGSDIFELLKRCVEKNKLDWDKLHSICTDGAQALTGINVGCVALLEKYLRRSLLKYHCIIHQQSLCCKTLQMSNVMDVVLKCINRIRGKALNRREFRQFLSDVDEEQSELLYHCDVRWLSRGKSLARFWKLRHSVLQFLIEVDDLPNECKLLNDNEWLNDFAFLVDITTHLNVLNLNLQGENKLFTNLYNDISAFKWKLQLFIGQIAQHRYENFPHVGERSHEYEIDTDKYLAKIEDLVSAFQLRFGQFAAEECNISLFNNPFTFPNDKIEALDKDLQLEIIDLKCNSFLKQRFQELPAIPTANDMITFWRTLPVNSVHLRQFAQRFICRFASTYRCEQTFSSMKQIKTKYRSCLTDINLGSLLRLTTTVVEPDIQKLTSVVQLSKSH